MAVVGPAGVRRIVLRFRGRASPGGGTISRTPCLQDGLIHYSVVTDPVKLSALLDVLKAQGVSYFRDGDLEVRLLPEPSAADGGDEDQGKWDGWGGLSLSQARAAGLCQ